MESDELKAHIETLRDAVDGLIAAIEFKKQMSDYPVDSIVALAKKVFDKTPAQSLNHIRAQVEAECSTPTEEQVLKAVYESGLHQYAPDVLKTRWKDGFDIYTPSEALMNFARKLLDRANGWREL